VTFLPYSWRPLTGNVSVLFSVMSAN
jgi:hypothetical protein